MVSDDSSQINRQERKKEETRKKIIETAMALFEKNGFEATTMEQISEEADIARRTLYNHFPVKEAILAEFIGSATKGSGSAIMLRLQQMPDTRTRLIHSFTQQLEMALKQEDIFRAYFAYRMYNKFQLPEDHSIKSGGHVFFEEIVKLGQQSGELRTDIPVEAFLKHLELVLAIIITDLIHRKDDLVLSKLIEENVDIFLNGVRVRGGDDGR